MRALAIVVSACAAAGCAGYQAGAFRDSGGTFDGARRTVGCLDVAVASAPDAAAVGPVAAFTIANRCDTPVWVDLPAVAVTATFADGARVALAPYDPSQELRPAQLEARRVAREHIEYTLPPGRDRPIRVCVDLSRVDAGQPAAGSVVVCGEAS